MKKNAIIFLLVFLMGSLIGMAQEEETNPKDSVEDVTSYFPRRSAPGIELNQVFNINAQDRFEFGANYLFTTWHKSNNSNTSGFFSNENFGMYQDGAAVTFNKALFNPIGEERWVINVGLVYNRINVEFFGLGFSGKLKASTFLNNNESKLGDISYKAEIGVTIFSFVNVYYGIKAK